MRAQQRETCVGGAHSNKCEALTKRDMHLVEWFVTHPKDVLHLEAAFLQPLDRLNLRQRNITDRPLALSLGVAQRLCRQPKVSLLEVTATKPFSTLRSFCHHPTIVQKASKDNSVSQLYIL